jgi:type I restriction enzyme S subunit
LDAETTRIDALITKKQRLIELFEERMDVYERTIFYGSADRVAPLRWFVTVGSGAAPTHPIEDGLAVGQDTQVVGGNGVIGFCSAHSMIAEPAVVVGRVGALCGNVHLIPPPAWITDNALWVRDIRTFAPNLVAIALRLADLNASAERTAQPLITGESVKSVQVPLLPASDQAAIADQITGARSLVSRSTAALTRQIALLRERRQAVITAAVTGKLDIPAA